MAGTPLSRSSGTPNGRAYVSFSGGKDSMLALHKAAERGFEICGLLCMLDETGTKTRSHGIPRALVEAQARSLSLPIVMPQASWDAYECEFRTALRPLRAAGITDIVFGDIDVDAHRRWEQAQCAAEGLRAQLPIWNVGRDDVVREILGLGYRARVVCVNARWLDESFAGRLFDATFVADLPADVDGCGENGEFHTFVFDGPRFRAAVAHRVVRVVRHEAKHPLGDGTYYFAILDA